MGRIVNALRVYKQACATLLRKLFNAYKKFSIKYGRAIIIMFAVSCLLFPLTMNLDVHPPGGISHPFGGLIGTINGMRLLSVSIGFWIMPYYIKYQMSAPSDSLDHYLLILTITLYPFLLAVFFMMYIFAPLDYITAYYNIHL